MKILFLCLKILILLTVCATLYIFLIWLLNYKWECGLIGTLVSSFITCVVGAYFGFRFIILNL